MTGGGYGGDDMVTLYQLTADGDETPLTSMNRAREGHACGVYRDAGGQQVTRLFNSFVSFMSDNRQDRH